MRSKPIIALTMGDPSGVGPEVMLRALADEEVMSLCTPVLVGNAQVLTDCAAAIGMPLPNFAICDADQFLGERVEQPTCVDIPFREWQPSLVGKVSAACGQAAFRYIEAAIAATLAGRVDAVTTGPINKEALHLAGIAFPGHTEIFAERCAAKRWCMMQYSPEITCTFVTVHCGYAEVPRLLSEQAVLDTIQLTNAALQKLLGRKPKLVICGLNPHAGEHGLFGDGEEANVIAPAVARAQADGVLIEGPLPPDTAFLPRRRAESDGFVCMYHDQGHIPLKALAFDSAVNTTLGLPIIRTSVDHGTAFDIAWQGVANYSSLKAAIGLAARLSRNAG